MQINSALASLRFYWIWTPAIYSIRIEPLNSHNAAIVLALTVLFTYLGYFELTLSSPAVSVVCR